MESARVYTYDVGFSFAGETRVLVETVNDEKAEDVVTFYDFDHQAVLLALDLQDALDHILRPVLPLLPRIPRSQLQGEGLDPLGAGHHDPQWAPRAHRSCRCG